MLQYVGQQHRERQGRGNENEAEECVRLCVGTSECMFSILGISGLSHFSRWSTEDVQLVTCRAHVKYRHSRQGSLLKVT